MQLMMIEMATKRRGRPPKAPGSQLKDIGVRLEPALLDDIKAIAVSQDTSQSEIIRAMLVEGVARHKKARTRKDHHHGCQE